MRYGLGMLAMLVAIGLAQAGDEGHRAPASPSEVRARQTACGLADCTDVLRVECTAGDAIACAAMALLVPGVDQWGEEAPERREALKRACELAGASCEQAASAQRGEVTEVRSEQRRLLAVGCDFGHWWDCVQLAVRWDAPPDADVQQVIASLGKAAALEAESRVTFASALLRGDPTQVRAGLRLLRQLTARGGWVAARALVAVRWGGEENLPADLRATLQAGCNPRCPGFAKRVAAGP